MASKKKKLKINGNIMISWNNYILLKSIQNNILHFCSRKPQDIHLRCSNTIKVSVEKKKCSTKRKVEDNNDVDFIACRFRMYPTKEQAHTLSCFAGSARFLWNRMVADYRDGKPVIRPAAYKKIDGLEWLKETDSIALCNVQESFERALSEYRSGLRGKPKFKKKHLNKESYTTNYINGNIVFENNVLTLPKIGGISIRSHRDIKEGGKIKHVTVTREPDGNWYASVLFEYSAENNEESVWNIYKTVYANGNFTHVGLDMSLPGFYVASDDSTPSYTLKNVMSVVNGEQVFKDIEVSFEKHYHKLENRIAFEQRKLSHMKKDSNNYRKQCKRIAKLHAKAKHQRNDFISQLAVRLAEKYDVISIEDLNMAAMKKALKFGKSVSDNAWGTFVKKLGDKCAEKGHILIKAGRWFPSSKKCCKCGYIHKELELKDRTYICPECGNAMGRDKQAAVNIDEEGIRIITDKEIPKKYTHGYIIESITNRWNTGDSLV